MTTPAMAATVYTPPYHRGMNFYIPFYGGSTYNTNTGYNYAWCKVGSGFTQASASMVVDGGPLPVIGVMGISISCRLTAYLYAADVSWLVPAYAQVCVNVYLINNDVFPAQQWARTIWTYVRHNSWGGVQFTNTLITGSAIIDTGKIIYNWEVAVELYVCAAVLLGSAGVCSQSGSWTSYASLKVNSIEC